MSAIRRQLSMFVPERFAAEIEAVRQMVDPIQGHLIPAHVTLCREDDLAGIAEAELDARLLSPALKPITLRFGEAEAFHGHGILMHATQGLDDFQALRELLLGAPDRRGLRPHMTLAHPRNSRAPGNSLVRAAALRTLPPITFSTISLIEQTRREPWRVLRSVELLDVNERLAPLVRSSFPR